MFPSVLPADGCVTVQALQARDKDAYHSLAGGHEESWQALQGRRSAGPDAFLVLHDDAQPDRV